MNADEREATSRRIRAARVFAGLTVEELAERIDRRGLGAKTIGNIERLERDAELHELNAIAEATGVPVWFLRYGFNGQAVDDDADPSVRDRVEALERERPAFRDGLRELRELRERLDRMQPSLDAVVKMAALWPTLAPPPVRDPAPPGSRSSDPSPGRSENQEGEGTR